MPLKTGQVLQNRYRIEGLLAQGGMGAVYRATDLTFGATVAVKENLDTSPQAQKQFAREAGILYGLRHPHLPRVTDYFFLPGQGQYLVMDFIEGQDLSQIVARGPAPEARAVAWIGQVLDALEYLHSQNPPIIHRDVKPANIKITPQGQVVLVDFGLVKVYDPLLRTVTGARAVTPGYAPPEQYGRGRTDARSDLYAVGATLYALLTGQEPPDGVDLMVGNATLTPPRHLNRKISANIENTILKAMQARPTDRPQTVREFRAAWGTPSWPRQPQPAPAAPVRRLPTHRANLPGWAWALGGLAALALALLFVVAYSMRKAEPKVVVQTIPVQVARVVVEQGTRSTVIETRIVQVTVPPPEATDAADSTATIASQQATGTAQAWPTATVRAQATATARARKTTTAKARATATARARRTATVRVRKTATVRARKTATVRAKKTASSKPKPTATVTPPATPAEWYWKGFGPFKPGNAVIGFRNDTSADVYVRVDGIGSYKLRGNFGYLAVEVPPGQYIGRIWLTLQGVDRQVMGCADTGTKNLKVAARQVLRVVVGPQVCPWYDSGESW